MQLQTLRVSSSGYKLSAIRMSVPPAEWSTIDTREAEREFFKMKSIVCGMSMRA